MPNGPKRRGDWSWSGGVGGGDFRTKSCLRFSLFSCRFVCLSCSHACIYTAVFVNVAITGMVINSQKGGGGVKMASTPAGVVDFDYFRVTRQSLPAFLQVQRENRFFFVTDVIRILFGPSVIHTVVPLFLEPMMRGKGSRFGLRTS